MSKNAHPVEKVYEGSVFVPIYTTVIHGKQFFTIAYYLHGKRKRRTFADHAEAKREAKSIAFKLSRGEMKALTLRDQDMYAYEEAVELLRPTGLSLNSAARQISEALKILHGSGLSLTEASKIAVEHSPVIKSGKTVREVVDELVNLKEEKGRCAYTVEDLRSRLGRFADAFQCPITNVGPTEIEIFLKSLKDVSPRTKNNFRRVIGTLIKFAKSKQYLARTHGGIDEVEKSTEPAKDPVIFTPEEFTKILQYAPDRLIPYLCVTGFAGLRQEEAKKLDWADVKLKEGHIEVRARNSKTRIRRIVPISQNLRKWLAPHSQPFGPITPYKNIPNQFQVLTKKTGIKWSRNVLRHSYISYRVAGLGQTEQVALEAGNSSRIILRHYWKVTTKVQANAWFAIVPEEPQNVLQFQTNAA